MVGVSFKINKWFSVINIFRLLLIFVAVGSFVIQKSYSQNPAYILNITNDQQLDDKNYEFDIYLQRTGTTEFEYANNSQYFINFNPVIKNGGALNFSILAGTCELNAIQQVLQAKLSVDNVNNRLRIAAHTPSGAGTGSIISNNGLGTRLGRFRITNTVSFANTRPNLSWYNGPSGFYTKVFAYVSALNVEITNSVNHITNLNNSSLPVLLSDFVSVTNNNNVFLKWKTEMELNNSGFSVQRKTAEDDWQNLVFVEGSGTVNQPVEYTYEDKKLLPGKYSYRLKQTDYNGNFEYFDLSTPILIFKPTSFEIGQNYPNPSNPKCKIDYQLPEKIKVNISVYDILGRLVATLVNEEKDAGMYTAEFNGTDVASGIYIYRITAGNFIKVKKMLLVK